MPETNFYNRDELQRRVPTMLEAFENKENFIRGVPPQSGGRGLPPTHADQSSEGSRLEVRAIVDWRFAGETESRVLQSPGDRCAGKALDDVE